MREEYQKTIILLSIILIFGGLYGSTYFDRGSARQNNTILFAIVIAVTMIGYLQTYKIKRWKEEEKTDYRLVYWSYVTLTCFLFLYMVYIIMSRSEKECIRVVRVMVSSGAVKIYHLGQDTWEARNKRKRTFKGGSHLDTEVSGDNGFVEGDNGAAVDIGVAEGATADGDSGNTSSGSKFSLSNLSNKQIMERMTVSGTVSKLFQGYKKIWKKILFIRD